MMSPRTRVFLIVGAVAAVGLIALPAMNLYGDSHGEADKQVKSGGGCCGTCGGHKARQQARSNDGTCPNYKAAAGRGCARHKAASAGGACPMTKAGSDANCPMHRAKKGCGHCDARAEHRKAQMAGLERIQTLLTEAKTAAESEGASKAAAKIDDALVLLKSHHKAAVTHQAMAGRKSCPAGGACKTGDKPQADADKPDMVSNTHCPIMGAKLDRDGVPDNLTRTFHGKTVGFCCGGCPVAWDKLSEQQKADKLEAATHSDSGAGEQG